MMRMKQIKKSLSLIFCMMLIVAMALFTTACNDKVAEVPKVQETEEVGSTEEAVVEPSRENQNPFEEITVLGEGETSFLFTVADKEGKETFFEIHTDEETVGDALLNLELISGEDGEFGLYVKSVNGIIADYDVDQTYWAFYINGEYAMSGVDTTTIEEGSTYMFKVEK